MEYLKFTDLKILKTHVIRIFINEKTSILTHCATGYSGLSFMNSYFTFGDLHMIT